MMKKYKLPSFSNLPCQNIPQFLMFNIAEWQNEVNVIRG